MAEIDFKRNFQKAVLIAFSFVLMVIPSYGFNVYVVVATIVTSFILSFTGNCIVDLFYYYLEKKREYLKQSEVKHNE